MRPLLTAEVVVRLGEGLPRHTRRGGRPGWRRPLGRRPLGRTAPRKDPYRAAGPPSPARPPTGAWMRAGWQNWTAGRAGAWMVAPCRCREMRAIEKGLSLTVKQRRLLGPDPVARRCLHCPGPHERRLAACGSHER
eukprot:scaffold53712_cov40-Phaeocystis_antarctica.AAC.1